MCQLHPTAITPEIESALNWKGVKAAFNKAAKAIFGGAQPIELHEGLITSTARALISGIMSGFGWDLSRSDTPPAILTRMQENVFVFSGFKTYQELKEASALLFDENGRRKSFHRFFQDIKIVNENYNKNYLLAEYNHAVASGQMAEAWKTAWENRDVAPMVTYQTAGDERVRESHKALDNISLPIESDFWKIYWPPNGWNCRCNAIQNSTATATANPLRPEIPEMFRNNVGINGVVFHKNHPYFNSPEQKQIRETLNDMYRNFTL